MTYTQTNALEFSNKSFHQLWRSQSFVTMKNYVKLITQKLWFSVEVQEFFKGRWFMLSSVNTSFEKAIWNLLHCIFLTLHYRLHNALGESINLSSCVPKISIYKSHLIHFFQKRSFTGSSRTKLKFYGFVSFKKTVSKKVVLSRSLTFSCFFLSFFLEEIR